MKRKNGMNQHRRKWFLACLTLSLAIGVSVNSMDPLICKAEKNAQAWNTQTKESQEEKDTDQFLNIGSVSKMYVTVAVMQLADQGKVDLDAPVTDYISDFKMADERYKEITVRMLMNHTSGLMGSVYGGMFLFDEINMDYHDTFLSLLQKEQLKYEPGRFNCYCNDGFTLLEILTERVSGMSFTEYLEENICKPLSLDGTGTQWDMDRNRQVPIYVNGNIKIAPECAQLIGAGGIMSNAVDVCNFGSAFWNGNGVLLSEKTKKEMAKNYRVSDCVEDFGLGWDAVGKQDYENAGVTVLSKGGDTFYQSASLVVAPKEEVSVAVLSCGGGSGIDEEVALKLLDIALSDQGIRVEHPEKEIPEIGTMLPEKYLAYEGIYADAQRTVSVSFPDKQYMLITTITSDREFETQYSYSMDGCFVEMSGDVASGKAIPAQPIATLTFEEQDGQIYLADPTMGYVLYKAPENKVSEKVQRAWQQRDGVSYFLVSGAASDATYMIENCIYTLHTSDAAWGYVNGHIMQDEDHACYKTVMPGTAFRDLSSLRVERVDGNEYLCMDDYHYRYISEECIPVMKKELAGVELKTGEACWFRLSGEKNSTIHLEIPEKAAVYVYDQYGNLRYSSYMTEYGFEVPLPEYGMIAFVGETGMHIGLRWH